MNLSLILQMAADTDPDRIGLISDGKRWGYGALFAAAKGAALAFRDSRCTHVALLDESSEASAIALFGAALAGIPYVPLNYRLADADLAALLDRIAPAYIIGDVARIARLRPDAHHTACTRASFVQDVERLAPGAADIEAADASIAVQIFTSGTTAAPKAALLRHSNLLSYILGTVEFGSASSDEAALVSVPPYHIAGISALLSSIYAMRRIVLLPAFEPDDWLKLASIERVTNAFLVPTMLSRIITRMDAGGGADAVGGASVGLGTSDAANVATPPVDLTSLRFVAYGGGRMPVELIRRALELFPSTGFTNAYGLTETSSTIALLGPDDHRAALASNDPAVRARLASVGQPLPTVEIE